MAAIPTTTDSCYVTAEGVIIMQQCATSWRHSQSPTQMATSKTQLILLAHKKVLVNNSTITV